MSYQNLIVNTGWTGIKTTYRKLMIQYFAIQNTISAITRKYWNTVISSLIGFRPFQTHCTILCSCLPIEMTWNRVFLSETGEKLRLWSGKTIWNQVFLSENSGKSRLYFGKMIWNQEFNIEKSRFMTVFIQIFIKKDLDNEYKLVRIWELSCSYCIVSYRIVSISNHIF